MRLDKDKWQKAFEKELNKAEKRQSSKVRRYYKNQYYKGAESFLSSGQTSFQLLFSTSELIKIYRDLYSDIGLQFAKWYARNFDKYIKKGVNPNQYVDEWQNSFASYGSAVGAERVTLVSGTAKITCGDKIYNLEKNKSVYIPKGEVHRLENQGEVDLEIIEVQTGDYLGEDDIIRLEDDYLRN